MMINISKYKVIFILFFMVILAYLVYILYKYFTKPEIKESFGNKDNQERDNKVKEIEREGNAYKSRLYVLKMFDTMFQRKPSHDEIGKYSSFGHEKAILNAILNDYDKLENSNVTARFLDNTFGSAMNTEHMSENEQETDENIAPKPIIDEESIATVEMTHELTHGTMKHKKNTDYDLLSIPEEEELYEPTIHAMYDKNILRVKLDALQIAYDDLSDYVSNQL